MPQLQTFPGSPGSAFLRRGSPPVGPWLHARAEVALSRLWPPTPRPTLTSTGVNPDAVGRLSLRCRLPARMHCGARVARRRVRRSDVAATSDVPDCAQHELEVQPQRPVGDVQIVKP